jgi:hypothetical protein
LVEDSGGIDGTYLLWTRGTANEYALTVVFKGTATHHKITKSAAGHWTVNNKDYGLEKTELKAFVEALQSPVKGFPVVLATPVLVEGDADDEEDGFGEDEFGGFDSDASIDL